MRFALLFAVAWLATASELSVLYQISPRGACTSDALRVDFDADVKTNEDGLLEIVGTRWSRPDLDALGCKIMTAIEGRPFANISSSEAPPAGYNTPGQLLSMFSNFASQYPGVAELIDVTAAMRQPLTINGNRIYALKISDNVAVDEDEPNMLFVSNHHSRELMTPQLALDTAQRLLSGQGNSQIDGIIRDYQTYIMWTLNPDGLNYVWSTDNMWRKNRRQNAGGSIGVDLNRNYPIGWSFPCGGSTTPSSETYRGTAPASEVEVQTMIAFQQDRHFAKVLDMHSYAREVRINYGDCATLPSSIDNLFIQSARAMASRMTGYVQARSCCMGGDIHYAYHSQSALAFLVETGTAFQPPAETMRAELVRVWPGTLSFLALPIPVQGHAKDTNGNPVGATFTFPTIQFTLGETTFASAVTGRFHIWLPVGSWPVLVVAPGFQDEHVVFNVNVNGIVQDVTMKRV